MLILHLRNQPNFYLIQKSSHGLLEAVFDKDTFHLVVKDCKSIVANNIYCFSIIAQVRLLSLLKYSPPPIPRFQVNL